MGSAAITLQMQPTGTAYVKAMQGSSWPQTIIAIFQDIDEKPVDLTGCVPRIFAGPNGAFADGTVMDAFSGTAQFGVTPDMTAIPGQYACSFSLPNTSCMDFKVDRLTLKVVLQQDGIYYAFLNQVPGANEDIQTQLNNIRDELLSKVTEQDIQTAISGITIGAVQLLRNSTTLPTLHGWSQNSSTAPTDEGGGFYRLPLNSNVAEILQNTSVATIHGATYTESFYFRTDSTTLGFSVDFYESNNAKSNIVQATVQSLGSGLYRAWATAIVGDTAIRAIDIKDLVYTDGTYIEIGKPKFEYGNKATDYSESDADFNDQIGIINQTLQTHTSEISQNAQNITLRVLTSTYDTYTAANDSAVSGAASAAAAAQTTATGAASAASMAQGTANNAATAAAAAQSTANSKAKVFTAQPAPPYSIGDLWTNSAGDTMVCKTARGSGNYTASDWQPASAVTVSRVATAESEIIQNAQAITTKVATTTYTTDMAGKVDKTSVISEINQSAEQITISAQKLNLAGYITATNLSTQGQTVINGGNITTGTISADRIDTTNLKAQRIYSTTNDYYAEIGQFPVTGSSGDIHYGSGIGLYQGGVSVGCLYSMHSAGTGEGGQFDFYTTTIGAQDSEHCYIVLQNANGASSYGISMNVGDPGYNPNGVTEASMTLSGGDQEVQDITMQIYKSGRLKAYLALNEDGINILGSFPTSPLNSGAWINENAGYWDARVTRIGNMCCVYGNITGSAVSVGTVLMHIPSGFRPLKRVSVNTYYYNPNINIRLDITPAGELVLMTAITYGGWLGLQLFYAID